MGLDNVVGLVRNLMQLSANVGDVGDDGAVPSLWSQLPKIVVVGGQSSGKSSVLEAVVGKDFLPRGTDIVTKRPLVVTLKQIEPGQEEYGVFSHKSGRKYTNYSEIRDEIEAETKRFLAEKNARRAPGTPQIIVDKTPMFLEIHSPDVPDLTVVDLPGTTTVAMKGQHNTIVQDLIDMAVFYISDPNSIILAVTPANADVANSQALQLAERVDPNHQRTIGVLTKIDLMDTGTDARELLENKKYPLKLGWVGVVNRSQADIEGNKSLAEAREKEAAWFKSQPKYQGLTNVTSQKLSGTLSTELIRTINQKLPQLTANIQSNIADLSKELHELGEDMPSGRGAMIHLIMQICGQVQDEVKYTINHGRGGGQRILEVFEEQLPDAMTQRPFADLLSIPSVKRIIADSDGYQPFLVAPENGYRALIREGVKLMESPAAQAVDAVDQVLRDISSKVITGGEVKSLERFRNLQSRIMLHVDQTLDESRKRSRDFAVNLVKMESGLVIPQLFQVADQTFAEDKQGMGPDAKWAEVSEKTRSYLHVVRQTLLNTVPKALVFHQVKKAEDGLLHGFQADIVALSETELLDLLGEDPATAQRRESLSKRIQMLRKANTEISNFRA